MDKEKVIKNISIAIDTLEKCSYYESLDLLQIGINIGITKSILQWITVELSNEVR